MCEIILEISSDFCIQRCVDEKYQPIGCRVINLSESAKTSTQIGIETGPIDVFEPDYFILKSKDHTLVYAGGNVYNMIAPYQMILEKQEGMHTITLVNDTIYWITVVSEDDWPTNIKVCYKGINSQEEPKCKEVDHDFIETHNFEGPTQRLKMIIADDNKVYLYFH